jgi:hypothetical protein
MACERLNWVKLKLEPMSRGMNKSSLQNCVESSDERDVFS